MSEYLINLDSEIFLWLNSFHALYWDVAMKMLTSKIIWVIMYISLLIAMYKNFGFASTVVMTIMIVLAIAAADQLTASVLRPMFERLRPSHPDSPVADIVHIVDGYRGGRYGFPSCHAANTFALATLTGLWFYRWRYSIFIILWALLNCYSRIYLGVHYPGDLLAGIVIGCFCGSLFYILGKFCIARFGGYRVQPNNSNDRPRKGTLNRMTFYYRPVDSVIWAGVITVVFVLLCSASLMM